MPLLPSHYYKGENERGRERERGQDMHERESSGLISELMNPQKERKIGCIVSIVRSV